jgi:PAS domain S-box-containing protein
MCGAVTRTAADVLARVEDRGRTLARQVTKVDKGGHNADGAYRSVWGARILWAIFVAACLAITVAGRLYFDAQRDDVVARKSAELSAVRDLKIEQILDWRAGLLQDGRTIAADPAVRDEIDRWMARPDDLASVEAVREWMASVVEQGGYSGVTVLSPDGSQWLSSSPGAELNPIVRSEAARAAGSAETTMSDLFLDPATGEPRLDVIAPLVGGREQTRGVVVLNRKPAEHLFPLLQKWPTPSASSETLLVRRDGAGIVFLNDVRFQANTALKLKKPLSDNALLAARAVNQPRGVGEGEDYRGVPVFGAVGQVGDTPWYIVAKVDDSEAFGAVVRSQWLISIGAVLLIGMVGASLMFAWRQREIAYYRRQLETERSQALLSQQYNLLTRYASDAVILADEHLRIVQANERAVVLYGYPEDELMLLTLDDLLAPDIDGLTTSLSAALIGDSGDLIEARQQKADGSVIDSEMTTQALVIDDQVLYLTITRDVTARKIAEAALRESDLRFRNIVECSPTAIYLYQLESDDRLILTDANPSSDRIIGIAHSGLVGKSIEEAFPRLVDTEIPAMYRAIARGELDPQTFEVPYEDERFHGYYLVTVFRTGPGLVAVDFVDISDRKQAEEELASRTEDLARSNAELEKFAYVASHDLQEPLRMVASYTQLLQRRYQGQLDDDADEFIAFAVDGATRMQRLINELLAYSRVGSQGEPLAEADLEPVLGEVLEVLGLSIAESNATVTHDPMPTVTCDPTQIGQVFQNLIANAIKFRGEDPPIIHIGAQSSEGEWVFSVKDNGLGIEPEYFDRIFVIFQRLQSRTEYPGTGMGLAICKRIIERHGGRTWVESDSETGSTFYFTLDARGDDHYVGQA